VVDPNRVGDLLIVAVIGGRSDVDLFEPAMGTVGKG
jgi:hypothetical protein